ncbi:MAG TPA: UvrD-helicase domain-containing protein [Spirochaetia bacterium]|nr:UvrD-helicase domain-containing protein [Spirochaetia bacterium]
MTKSSFPLNPQQAEAVETTDGPLLIVAGAGSGKTRVITCRIARLLEKGVPQSQVLAVTFTNKAAREMAHRVRELVPQRLAALTVCTFHALGARIVREQHAKLGYRASCSIYDSQDQAVLLRDTAREMGPKAEGIDLQAAAQVISAVKTRRVEWNNDNRHVKPLYTAYEKSLRLYSAVDFDDLIMLPLALLEKDAEVRAAYNERYRYILVDEFQDTSRAQYELMKHLAGPRGNVCVVGDDDQSIYSWRGASYENIMLFERDFPGARVITLSQNYRSSRTILDAANALISRNTQRKKKDLWTGLAEGELVEVHAAETELEEAQYIASRIRTLMIRDSLRFEDFGVLLRANHLTRAIEEIFRKENIPYVVSGGMSFFERQEVRDMLAYLKLAANPDDDVSLLRVVNTPRRGIGRKLLEHTAELAGSRRCSLFSALAALGHQPGLGIEEKAMTAAAEFVELMQETRAKFLSGGKGKLTGTLRELVEEIDYFEHLVVENRDAKDRDVVKWKYGNVESLISSVADFEEDPDQTDPSLFDYLNRVALASRDDLDDRDQGGRVNLMTIHAAKGLEFPVVFLAAVEKDIIPHARSVEEADANLEEERRLFYVAITRARKRLFLSHCATRRRMGKPVDAFPSPFLEELPADRLSAPAEDTDFVPDFKSAWKKIAGE